MYRIAIIDDNPAWCFALENFLCQSGFAAASFNSANAFLAVANQFDLALIDFSMPSPCYQKEINGPELIVQLKQQLKRPPILILVSAYFAEGILQDARDLCPQADAYLSKSVGLKGILQQVQQFTSSESVRPHAAKQQNVVSELRR